MANPICVTPPPGTPGAPSCTSTTGPNFSNTLGNTTPTNPQAPLQNGLVPFRPGLSLDCPPTQVDLTSYAFQLTQNNDACVQDSLLTESINIGGADVWVYKLLGVHEQCKLVDATGFGQAISGGAAPGYPASNAFEYYTTEWHSLQTGSDVTSSTFIGYDFGDIKTLNQTRRMYGIDTAIHKHITAFAIKQDPNPANRATQVRLEYSNDNCKWYGAGLATLPDDDCLNTILMKRSAPARYWRLRPTAFNSSSVTNNCGVVTSTNMSSVNVAGYWGVQALQLFHNYEATDISNIQDKILMENRDREYNTEPYLMKGYYDLVEVQTEMSRFGIELPSLIYNLSISFTSCVAILGRPLVVGDIIQLPSETQYSSSLTPILKWVEVTDVTWDVSGYSPSWIPLLLYVTCQPAYASEETQDIFGDLAEEPVTGGLGLQTQGAGRNPNFQDFSDIATFIKTAALDNVPENGRETSGYIQEFTDVEYANAAAQGLNPVHLAKIGLNPKGKYGEDGMPPNQLPFTEGPAFPIDPTPNQYHRLTYVGPAQGIATRLYRYSTAKTQWIYLESDLRALENPRKPTLQEFIKSPTRRRENAILKEPIPNCQDGQEPFPPGPQGTFPAWPPQELNEYAPGTPGYVAP